MYKKLYQGFESLSLRQPSPPDPWRLRLGQRYALAMLQTISVREGGPHFSQCRRLRQYAESSSRTQPMRPIPLLSADLSMALGMHCSVPWNRKQPSTCCAAIAIRPGTTPDSRQILNADCNGTTRAKIPIRLVIARGAWSFRLRSTMSRWRGDSRGI